MFSALYQVAPHVQAHALPFEKVSPFKGNMLAPYQEFADVLQHRVPVTVYSNFMDDWPRFKVDIEKLDERIESLPEEIREQMRAIPHARDEGLSAGISEQCLNIAEGNGKYLVKDRCRFFDIANGSTLECAAGLDVMAARGKLTADQILPGKQRLQNIVRMLMGLIKRNSNREYEKGEVEA